MARSPGYNPLLKTYPDSEKINAVSEGAELLYVRLIAASDDHGQFWGDAAFVWAKLFTHRMQDLTIDQIEQRIQELETIGLLVRYEAAGKRYVQLLDVYKTGRADRKCNVEFPDGPASICCPSKKCHLLSPEAVTDDRQLSPETLPADTTSDSPTQPNSSQPNRTPPPPNSVTNADGMAAAEKILIAAGVEHPSRAVESAFARGATPTDIERIVQHFRACPEAWTPGALCHRVKNFHPDQTPEKGWPKPSAKFTDRLRASGSAERKQQQETRERDEAAKRASQLAAQVERFGPILSQWSEEQTEEFIRRAGIHAVLLKTQELAARNRLIIATMAKQTQLTEEIDGGRIQTR